MEKIEKREFAISSRKHNMMHNTKEINIEVGDLVLIRGEEKHKGK